MPFYKSKLNSNREIYARIILDTFGTLVYEGQQPTSHKTIQKHYRYVNTNTYLLN